MLDEQSHWVYYFYKAFEDAVYKGKMLGINSDEQYEGTIVNLFYRLPNLHNLVSRWWMVEQNLDSMIATSQWWNKSLAVCLLKLTNHRKKKKTSIKRDLPLNYILQPLETCSVDQLRDTYHLLHVKQLSSRPGYQMKIEITLIRQLQDMRWQMALWTPVRLSSVGHSIANWRWEILSLNFSQRMIMVKRLTAVVSKSLVKSSTLTHCKTILEAKPKISTGHIHTRKMTWKHSTRQCSEYKTCVGPLND